MDVSRLEELMSLFERALAVPQGHRPAFLEEACGGDSALRQELDTLLEAHDSAADYFDDLAAHAVAPAYVALHRGVSRPADSGLLQQLQAALGDSYRIEKELGGGGMSRVYLAEETRLGREVVVKVLPPEWTASVSVEHFRREIRLVAQLQHPHIVPLLTSDATDSLLWYTMPFVAGESLRARLAGAGALPIRDARKAWRDVLDALTYAHSRGVVHRDIKPANILLSGRNALVIDFGIARAIAAAAGAADTAASDLVPGTPAYMAPEQLTGDRGVDHRADLFAAALVMHEMLEGRPAFAGRSRHELVLARLGQDPPVVTRPDCPRALGDLVLRCLARNPADRPASADAVLAELESVSPDGGSRGEAAAAVGEAGRPRYDVAGASAGAPRPVPTGSRGRRRLRKILVYGLAGATVAGLAFAVTELTRRRVGMPVRSAASPPSIAVLPLRNIGGDPADAALADGMTEELNAALGRGGTVRVIPSTSVLALTSRRLDLGQIAESLHVSHVLEGTFQRIDSRLRLQIRLVNARDGATRWSDTYDREMGDIFATQDDIARAVALELGVRLSESDHRGSTSPRHTPSLVAHEWYLRGMNTALQRSDSGRRKGLDYFGRAIAADSNFAAAYAGQVWLLLGEAGESPGDHREWFDRGREAALRAVALDDSLAQAHSALGWARLVHREWPAAEAEFKRAIALDPSVHRGFEGLARTYMITGRPAEELAAARLGMEADPFSHSAIREMALALSMNGRCDEALALMRPLKALTPPAGVAGVIMGLCYAGQRMWPEAIAEFRWAHENADARAALAFLGYALARSGRRNEASTILSDLLAGREYSHGAFGIAVVYAGLGDYDEAFAWLGKAEAERSSRDYIRLPLFDDLHRDPRFTRLMSGQRN